MAIVVPIYQVITRGNLRKGKSTKKVESLCLKTRPRKCAKHACKQSNDEWWMKALLCFFSDVNSHFKCRAHCASVVYETFCAVGTVDLGGLSSNPDPTTNNDDRRDDDVGCLVLRCSRCLLNSDWSGTTLVS